MRVFVASGDQMGLARLLLASTTTVKLVQLQNAQRPMLVTGPPSIMPGMINAPPGPVYPFVLIMRVACASTGA